jgi:hypothetical protein
MHIAPQTIDAGSTGLILKFSDRHATRDAPCESGSTLTLLNSQGTRACVILFDADGLCIGTEMVDLTPDQEQAEGQSPAGPDQAPDARTEEEIALDQAATEQAEAVKLAQEAIARARYRLEQAQPPGE